MEAFWRFARMMLQQRRLVVTCLVAAVLDAMCALGGLASLMLVVQKVLGQDMSIQQMAHNALADPDLIKWIGDRTAWAQLLPSDDFSGYTLLIVVIMILAAIGACFRFLYNYTAITMSFRTIMRIRKLVYYHLVHTSLAVLNEGGTTDKISRLIRDTGQLAVGFSALVGRAIRSILMGLVGLSVALYVNYQLAALFLISLAIVGVLLRKFGKWIRRAARRAMQGYSQMLTATSESLHAAATIKTHQAEGYERRRFNSLSRQVYAAEMRARTVQAASNPTVELLAILGVSVVSIVAGWMIFHRDVAPTELVNVLMALGMAGSALRPLTTLNNKLQEAGAAATRIDEVLSSPVERGRDPADRTDPLPRLPRHHDSVTFDRVTFTYPGAQTPAIREVTLHVPFGQCVALVGANGSGKTTLLNLLPRLYDPDSGRVLIDGIDISTASLRSVRSQMAMVSQQSVLFEGSIARNIAYGRSHIDRALIVEAAKAAYADEFITALPHGYDTKLSELGAGLSGGQRQRLCIARALLRNPAILILDEATSQIDADSEAKINRVLRQLRQDRTVLVIAHRLSTVIDADRIVVMDQGRLVAQDTHANLLNTCEPYRVLAQTQLLADTQ